MLVIFKDNKITAIDKDLAASLHIDLTKLSEIINLLDIQLASLKSEILTLNSVSFKINEINLISTENLKVFSLNIIDRDTSTFQKEPTIEILNENDFPHIIKQPNEPEIKDENDFLVTPQENKLSEENKFLNIDLININNHKEENEEILPKFEEKIKLEFSKTKEISSLKEEREIEISFEDDLEEVREILSSSKNDFNNAIINELKKASDELGIDYNELVTWFNQLIEQIKGEKKHLYKYILTKNYNSLHESYHKLKGAALNLRLSKIAIVLKKLDELSKNQEDIEKIKLITDDFYKLIENDSIEIKQTKENNQSSDQPDKMIEDIVIQTIKTYLQTQNEAQFEKDKKYIEKLLNTKINSLW